MNGDGNVARERADYTGFSDQPRFGEDGDEVFFRTYHSIRDLDLNPPDYGANNIKRDTWLQQFVKREPILMGVISSVVAIDKNRGWKLVGGRNQVGRFSRILHNWQAAPGIFGWRMGVSHASRSFWSTDMGGIVEVGRASKSGPLRALYSVDPTKCALTGNEEYPLEYYPNAGKPLRWSPDDFIRAASLPDLLDKNNGMGYCAVSRCLELAVIMIAIYEHDNEMLASRAPRGILLLQGISQNQWDNAMEIREASLDAKHRDYFDQVAVLASKGAQVDAKLVAISQLPQGFSLKEWSDMLIYGYALSFGFDPSEFWPVQFGALGRGTETEVQHEKATGKGRLDFPLSFQEQLQEFLPPTLVYAFDQRDEKGDLLQAQVNKAWVDVVMPLFEKQVLTREQSLDLLAQYGVVPRTWVPTEIEQETDLEDDASELDDDLLQKPGEPAPSPEADEMELQDRTITPKMRRLREELLENASIRRAAEEFPAEPIVQYNYPANTMITVWRSGEDLLRPRIWNGIQLTYD